MDCICLYKQQCLSVSISSNNSYYLLTQEGISEIDTQTRHVRSRIQSLIKYTEEKTYTLQISSDLLYVFSASPEYTIYSTDPPEYQKSVMCSGKKPYIPSCILVALDHIIFSTLSHSNIYLFSISALNTLGQIKRPAKLKTPNKVQVNMLAFQQNGVYLAVACSDGAIRIWNLDTKEELLPLIDTENQPRNKKNVAKGLKNSNPAMLCVCFSLSGSQVLCGDEKGFVYLWNFEDDGSLICSKRISELGVVDVSKYDERFLAVVRETRLYLIENLMGKIVATALYTLNVNDCEIKRAKCLHVFDNGKILLFWPPQNIVYLLEIIKDNPQDLVRHLPSQSLQDLIPSPISYHPYFFSYLSGKISSFSVQNNEISTIKDCQNLSTFYINPMTSPLYILTLSEKEKETKLFDISLNQETTFQSPSAVFSGPSTSVSSTVILLQEDRTSIAFHEISSKQTKVFQVSLKIKKLFPSPNFFGVTYETLHEHSVRLSKGFRTKSLIDVELDCLFRLEYDESLICLEWQIESERLVVASNKRICLLDSSLTLIRAYGLLSRPLSVYWYGNILMFSNNQGVFYCGDSIKLVLSTIGPAVICAVLADRVYLLMENEVKAFPVSMLEPLLWGSLESGQNPETIEKIARLLPTSSVSKEMLKKLLKFGFPSVSYFLSEKTFTPLQTKLEIQKSMHCFKDIEKTLFRHKSLKDHPSLIEDIHLDHNWKLEKTLLPNICSFLDSKGQLKHLSKFLKLSKNFYDLSLVHQSIGTKYPPDFDSLKISDFSEDYFSKLSTSEPVLEDLPHQEGKKLEDFKLGFGESAYSQQVNKREILTAYNENISQVFGWDSLKPAEKIVPKFMDQEVREEEEEETDKIYLYFRCDEGKGNLLTDVMLNKTVLINEDQWAGMLDEGEPLDYDDKWGKQASPNYRVLLFRDSFVVVEDLDLGSVWSLEFWISVSDLSFNLFVLGSFIVQVDQLQIKVVNNMIFLELSETEAYRKLKAGTWEHFCIGFSKKKISVYLNSVEVFHTKTVGIDNNKNLTIGGFSGHITEIRIWKSFRDTEKIRENYKCPLEILSEKRKKKWVNLKINKTEAKPDPKSEKKTTEVKLLKPDSGPRPEIKPLGLKKLQGPGFSPVFPKPVQKNPLESLYKLFELKSYTGVLEEIKKIPESGLKETLNLYKFVSKMMLHIEKYKRSSRPEKHLKAAACLNLLVKVKISSDHRKQVAMEAVKTNIEIGNFGIASKMIYNLLDHCKDNESKELEDCLSVCVSNDRLDKAEGFEEIFQQTQEYFTNKLNAYKETQ